MKILRRLAKSDRFKIFLFHLLHLLPVKRHKIVFCNFSGKRTGDSPRAICDALQRRHPDWDLVWLVHPKYKPPVPPGTRGANFGQNSLRMIYELATAKVWVDSHTKFAFTRKGRWQFYMETWHGGISLKKIEGDAAQSLDEEYMKRVNVNASLADVFLSNGAWLTALYRRAFGFSGEVQDCGLPRNDCLVFPKRTDRIHSHYGIPASAKIVLYAPTFRADESVDCYSLDSQKLLAALERKMGESWVLLVRMHPVVMQKKLPFAFSEKVIDATPYPDMQALLLESDLLVTDYSSCMFDFSLLKRPCLIFAPDIPSYKKDRDFYFELHDLPFPLAEDNDSLAFQIERFDEAEYAERLAAFNEKVGLRETGLATASAVERIERWVES